MNTKAKSQKRVDIVVGSKRIKEALEQRRADFRLTYTQIVKDAKEAGITGLTKSALSLYFNNDSPVAGFPTQRHIIFLCLRYGITLGINVDLHKDISKDDLNGKYKSIATRFSEETNRMG